jgi:hypothetical protein
MIIVDRALQQRKAVTDNLFLPSSHTLARAALLDLAEGCRLKRDIRQDACIRRADVEIPEGRLIDRLRDEQDAGFNLLPMEQGTARNASGRYDARQRYGAPS